MPRFLAVLLLLAPLTAAAQDVPGPSFEDVLSLRSVGSPALSPDGRHVAFTVSATDWEGNRYDTEIWLAKDGGTPFPITRTEDGSSTNPQWSPDGQWIAFAASRGNGRQVFALRADGGEAWPITAVDGGVGAFAWSPDGARLAFTRTEPEVDSVKARKERYGAFEIDDAEYRRAQLWVLDVPPAPSPTDHACRAADSTATDCIAPPEPERLTEGDLHVTGFRWHPDGTHLLVEHRPTPLINDWMNADISVLDVADGTLRPLVDTPGPAGGARWSPDGTQVAYTAGSGDVSSDFFRNNRLMLVPADGGTPRQLAANVDENLGVADWNAAGLFVQAWQKTRRPLFRVDLASGDARPALTTPDRVWQVAFSTDGRRVAFSAHTDTRLNEIYLAAAPDFPAPTRVTDMTAQIDGWHTGTSRMISWTSEDGAEIEGVLFTPPDFDPQRKYPLLVAIHGGPTGIDYPTLVDHYVYPIMHWLNKGAVVLQPNYRGSAGYGEAFRSLNVGNLGVGDMWDVMSGVDHLIAQGFVDETKMGAMGWSQGGYISAFLTTNTDRFAAISVGAGISNWMTYYVNTDIHPFTRQYLRATPWDDPAVYAKTSPMTNILQASTPTLIQHGENDARVPIPNAYELLQGLRDQGVPARLVVYNNFGHGITRPKERLAATWHNWQWFNRWLWNEEVELP